MGGGLVKKAGAASKNKETQWENKKKQGKPGETGRGGESEDDQGFLVAAPNVQGVWEAQPLRVQRV